jgi:hypothetical protein
MKKLKMFSLCLLALSLVTAFIGYMLLDVKIAFSGSCNMQNLNTQDCPKTSIVDFTGIILIIINLIGIVIEIIIWKKL